LAPILSRRREIEPRRPASGVDIVTLAGQVDAILSMLPDGLDVEACLWGGGGVLGHVGPSTVIIEAYTMATATTRRAPVAFVAKGWAFIDAPNCTLMFMVGRRPRVSSKPGLISARWALISIIVARWEPGSR
jgi:3-hydroxyisobutyrate dehydrogenase-like beta-hydroxyacid dehydrogenase